MWLWRTTLSELWFLRSALFPTPSFQPQKEVLMFEHMFGASGQIIHINKTQGDYSVDTNVELWLLSFVYLLTANYEPDKKRKLLFIMF